MSDFDTWRASLPEPAMRMTWWRELKWLLAAKMIFWSVKLMAAEMSAETAHAFAELGDRIKNDPSMNTVKMQPPRRKANG